MVLLLSQKVLIIIQEDFYRQEARSCLDH
jgi:hypothetical protein